MKKGAFSIEQLREAVSYDPATGVLTWRHRPNGHFPSLRIAAAVNGRMAGREALAQTSQYGYKVGCIFQQKIMSHHAAYALMTGRWPEAQIDHINGNRADNRWINLRDVSAGENAKNLKRNKKNTSGRTGISWNKALTLWHAYISENGKMVHLGFHGEYQAAVTARSEAERRLGFHPNHGRAS